MNETTEVGITVKRGPGRPRKNKITMNDDGSVDLVYAQDLIEHWAYRLELAAALRAGVMDSESRHLEVARQKEAIMLAVAAEMRAL